jgi:enoyl-CoA hydratase
VIERSDNGGITILKLAHGKANTMDIELCRDVIEQFNQLKSSTARAVVLTGQGSIFSAGVDLVRISAGGSAYIREFLPVLNAMFDAVFHFPKPVVAAINGHAIAGGCVLACCCDGRLMARDGGRIGVTELLVGVPFPALAFEIMRFVTAARYFPRAVYGGETYAPEDGTERGWIDEIAAPADLVARAVANAQELAALPAKTYAMTKRQMRLPVIERMKREGHAIDAAITDIWAAPEAIGSIGDYVARTLKKR